MGAMPRWMHSIVAAGRKHVVAARLWAGAAWQRLRRGWLRVVEATVAASVAWLISVELLGHPQPFFAPAAALIVLGVTQGQRLQRAVEIVVGVAVGVLVADAINTALGPHTLGSVAAVTVLTFTAAVLLGGGPILAVQATVSAVYVAVVASPDSGLGLGRFSDALAGGAVALLVNQLPLHRDPVDLLLAEACRVIDTLSAILVDIADALASHDHDAARAALERARGTDPAVAAFQAAVSVGLEASRLDPLRRRRQGPLRRYEEVAKQIDYAVRNVRVLARGVVVVTRGPIRPPAALSGALRELAEAVTALSAEVKDVGDGDGPAAQRVREHALTAVRAASSALTHETPLPVAMIVWQVRSTAVDLLRGTGLELAAVLEATDEALGPDPLVDGGR
jgi:uncharacterized membrane protein YgaE (UPF0421/DUF939 family)